MIPNLNISNYRELDKLILEDQFKLSSAELLAEAQLAAECAAERMGWAGVGVIKDDIEPEQLGEFLCHSFIIFGYDNNPTEEGGGII